MKTIFLFITLILALSVTHAQPASPLTLDNFEGRALLQTNMMVTRLSLTLQQQEPLRVVNKQHLYAIVMLGTEQLSWANRAPRIALIDSTWKISLKQVLTDSQYVRYFLDEVNTRRKIDSLRLARKG